MNIIISNKDKKELFISIFQVLKNCSSNISCIFEKDFLHIQGMDKSHVCLFDIKINQEWFHSYNVNETNKISFDSNVFHSIISTKSENQNLIFSMDNDNEDILHIHFVPTLENFKQEDLSIKKTKKKIEKNTNEKNELKKFFKMPLQEFDYEEMNIPVVDYDAEFTLCSKIVTDIFSQLNNFGNDIIIKCSEESIYLNTNSISGEMCVQIPIDDLTSYSIIEGEELELIYSLIYVNKMCITNKISTEIDFSLSKTSPMKITYNLGDNSHITFYIAPKLSD
jgi:proliferating cell nuclear antigen